MRACLTGCFGATHFPNEEVNEKIDLVASKRWINKNFGSDYICIYLNFVQNARYDRIAFTRINFIHDYEFSLLRWTQNQCVTAKSICVSTKKLDFIQLCLFLEHFQKNSWSLLVVSSPNWSLSWEDMFYCHLYHVSLQGMINSDWIKEMVEWRPLEQGYYTSQLG